MRLLLALLVACGSSYEPKPESEADADEAMVVTFEEMAKLAGEKPTCTRWADENGRRWGKQRLQVMVDRIQRFDPAKQEVFRAKYGKRIDAARDAVLEISTSSAVANRRVARSYRRRARGSRARRARDRAP